MDERSSKREVLDIKIMARHGGQRLTAEVYDLSAEGCMLAVEDEAALGVQDTIALELPEVGLIEGTLVWVEKEVGGVRFATPLLETAVKQLQDRAAARFRTTFHDQFGRRLAALQRRFNV